MFIHISGESIPETIFGLKDIGIDARQEGGLILLQNILPHTLAKLVTEAGTTVMLPLGILMPFEHEVSGMLYHLRAKTVQALMLEVRLGETLPQSWCPGHEFLVSINEPWA